MAVRNSWAVSAAGGLITTEEARIALGGAFHNGGALVSDTRSGWLPSPSNITPGQVTATGTPDGFVHTAPFMRVQQSIRGKGPYVWCNDATFNTNVLSTPADPTNQRNDLIIAQQSDAFYGDGTNALVIRQVVGTPAGSPVDPTVSGSSDYILLARVRVTANASAITSGMIDDLRPLQWTCANGGELPINTLAERTALSNPWIGLTIYRRDLLWHEVWMGSGWRVIEMPVASTLSTLTTNVTSPYDGQTAYVLNDKGIYRYRTAGGWVFAQFTESGGGYSRYRENSAVPVASTTDTKIPYQLTVDSPGSVNGTTLVTPSGTGNIDFTLGIPGTWSITASMRFANAAGAFERFICLAKSSDIANTRYAASSGWPGAGNSQTLTVATQRKFAANDAVSVVAFQSSGGPVNTDISMFEAFHLSFNWEGN